MNRASLDRVSWTSTILLKQAYWIYLHETTIIQKIFETKFGFHVKYCLTGKVQFLFFSSFWQVLKEFSFWHWDWALVYHSSKFWDFPEFSLFPKIPSLKSFGNSFGNSYTPCLLLIIALRFTCGERKTW